MFSENKFNFKKYSKSTIDSLKTPYDYGSVRKSFFQKRITNNRS